MPIYEYRCSQCGEKFEKLVRSTSGPVEVRCPACEDDRVERLISAFGFVGASSGASSYGGSASSCSTSFGG